jgi:hypothetical protein
MYLFMTQQLVIFLNFMALNEVIRENLLHTFAESASWANLPGSSNVK